MTFFPGIPTSPPLAIALLSRMDAPGAGPVWFEGSRRLAGKLVLAGYTLAKPPVPVRQIVWMNQLPANGESALEKLRAARTVLSGCGRIFVMEPSAPLSGQSDILTRFAMKMGWFHRPDRISLWFLQAGFAPVSQFWPQGLRSWLVTSCVQDSRISNLLPAGSSQSPNRIKQDWRASE